MSGRFNVQKVGHDNAGLTLDEGVIHTGRAGLSPDAVSSDNLPTGNDRKTSFTHYTLEALPRPEYYKSSGSGVKRPSLGELCGEEVVFSKETYKDPIKPNVHNVEASGPEDQTDEQEHTGGIKLGWINGVLVPCLLNIWGVMLFLRLSWVVAQSGISGTLIIIAISSVVCIITTLSLSAICTNGEVKGGGIYYIISRSLGPEFGASVGVIFASANAVSVSMNTIGFCNSLNDLLAEHGLQIIDGGDNDVRIIGVITICIMTVICAVGMEWESKAQNFLIVVIIAAIFDFLIGACLGPSSDLDRVKGFTGLSTEVFQENWGANYRKSEGDEQNFFTVFAIFFPSVTGIQAGANISGDLKDPSSAIPKGTMLALLISMVSYVLFVLFAGAAALRDASGMVTEMLPNATLPYWNCTSRVCDYGLHNSYTVMQLMSSNGNLIYAGCFAATLSTALTNLLSVPRLIQALGIDRIYPGLIFFSKGYGPHKEPYRGYVLTFVISTLFLMIAHLNVIAPLISNFYLASYALINFCTFHAGLVRPLGWRPTFRYYNTWLSLLGSFMCVVIMFLINWITSLLTFVIFFALYLVVVYRNPQVNWGSSTQAQTYKTALMTAYKLSNSTEHVKNYQPQLLVLSGQPQSRPPLIDLASLITRNNSLCICAEICKNRLNYKLRSVRTHKGMSWLGVRKIKSFFVVVDGVRMFDAGARALMQTSGVGRMRPNVLMMGYKNNWQSCPSEEMFSYFNTLHDAFENRLAVIILKMADGLDSSPFSGENDLDLDSGSTLDLTVGGGDVISHTGSLLHNDSSTSLNMPLQQNVLSQTSLTISGSKTNNNSARPIVIPTNAVSNHSPKPSDILRKKMASEIIHNYPDGQQIRKDELESMMFFAKKQKGTIDVWWLYDDGGLTILLPYILSTRSSWSDCKLRVFALTNRHHELKSEELCMASLLSKFRIDYSSLTMIHNITDPPETKTQQFFDSLIKNFRNNNGETVIEDAELESLRERTNRQLKLRELLLKHSNDASLIVMSLPMPRKGMVSAGLYMAWLEALTRDMPPFLLVRGNQQSVLTFYS
ncbi:bumetanide-sensitive sodium-(potassium)-chloride cotransporter isoform X2 [Nilaparvata lugens]|nr:bumetanide-sensitive sodium-(potassium)-chloride cotransporter isoform X2 [Nilaparvata lugens]